MNKTKDALVTRRYLITGAQRTSNYWWASIISFGGLAFFITGFASFLQKSIFIFNRSKTIAFLPQGLIMCFYGSLGLLFGFYLWCTVLWKVGDGFNEFNKNQGFVRIFRWGLPGKNRRVDFQYKIDEIESVRVELKEGVNPRRIISLKIKRRLYTAQQPTSELNSAPQTKFGAGERLAKNEATQNQALVTKVRPKADLPNSAAPSRKAKNTESKAYSSQGFTVPLTRVGQPISLEKIESQASELAQFLRVSLETSYLDS